MVRYFQSNVKKWKGENSKEKICKSSNKVLMHFYWSLLITYYILVQNYKYWFDFSFLTDMLFYQKNLSKNYQIIWWAKVNGEQLVFNNPVDGYIIWNIRQNLTSCFLDDQLQKHKRTIFISHYFCQQMLSFSWSRLKGKEQNVTSLNHFYIVHCRLFILNEKFVWMKYFFSSSCI